MNKQRLREIQTIARELVGEIEWVGLFGFDDASFRRQVRDRLQQPAFVLVVHDKLDLLFALLERDEQDRWVGHQEPELEAAGMVNAALKRVLMDVSPSSAFLLRYFALTAKFKRIPLPTTQAPPNVWVPGMREQLAAANSKEAT